MVCFATLIQICRIYEKQQISRNSLRCLYFRKIYIFCETSYIIRNPQITCFNNSSNLTTIAHKIAKSKDFRAFEDESSNLSIILQHISVQHISVNLMTFEENLSSQTQHCNNCTPGGGTSIVT